MTDGVSIIIDPYEPGGLGGVICYDQIMDPTDELTLLINHSKPRIVFTVEEKLGDFKELRGQGRSKR
jgi:hypothetical protein